MLDTDQLRSFLAIIDTGSFTRAAEQVHKTQSAVSMNVRKLEEVLGKKLFLKHGRGIRLSNDGEKLVSYARDMLRVESEALHSLAGKAVSGHVRFGIPDDYCEIVMPEILQRFVRENPLVELSVVCEPSVDLAKRIQARDLDLAVVTDCSSTEGAEILRESPLRFVVSASSQAHLKRPLPLALDCGSCEWQALSLKALEGAKIAHHSILVSKNYTAIAPIVEAGLAVAILPHDMIRNTQKIVGAECGLPPLPINRIGLMRSGGRASQAADALVSIIRNVLRRPTSFALAS